jgi:hypothetical protein
MPTAEPFPAFCISWVHHSQFLPVQNYWSNRCSYVRFTSKTARAGLQFYLTMPVPDASFSTSSVVVRSSSECHCRTKLAASSQVHFSACYYLRGRISWPAYDRRRLKLGASPTTTGRSSRKAPNEVFLRRFYDSF